MKIIKIITSMTLAVMLVSSMQAGTLEKTKLDSTSLLISHGQSIIIQFDTKIASTRIVDNYNLFRVSNFDAKSVMINMIKSTDQLIKGKEVATLIIGDEDCNKYVLTLKDSNNTKGSVNMFYFKAKVKQLSKADEKGSCRVTRDNFNPLPRKIMFKD